MGRIARFLGSLGWPRLLSSGAESWGRDKSRRDQEQSHLKCCLHLSPRQCFGNDESSRFTRFVRRFARAAR